MTNTMNAAVNARRRPTLSEQIDRLDRTLDGLAEGLNEAVADAVKAAVGAAVREAVQATLTEVFTNPDVLAHLREVAAPPPQQATPPPASVKPRAAGAAGLAVPARARGPVRAARERPDRAAPDRNLAGRPVAGRHRWLRRVVGAMPFFGSIQVRAADRGGRRCRGGHGGLVRRAVPGGAAQRRRRLRGHRHRPRLAVAAAHARPARRTGRLSKLPVAFRSARRPVHPGEIGEALDFEPGVSPCDGVVQNATRTAHP